MSPSVANVPRPMTLSEKLLANAAIETAVPGQVSVGETVRVKVSWAIASELAWFGMEKTYNLLDRPQFYDPSHFWLAADHRVDPRINHLPAIAKLIERSERIAKEQPKIDYQPPNQTILHTEFFRQRAQPGQIIIGADSHTCSAGGLGAFAVGLGAADVCLPLVSGETWFTVPETCQIRLTIVRSFVGKPHFSVGGKDTILYILGELKRNTVAAGRAVEYTGPGLEYLTPDARFAICNMTTEFGGLTGICVPDKTIAEYISGRPALHKSSARYFEPDPEALYAFTHEIDLSTIPHLIALYPSPDKVVSAQEVQDSGLLLDGVFIGACTTTLEDLILGALVLEVGLQKGLRMVPGERKVTPGSVQIIAILKREGLIDIYERAGFDVGAPGCSYCIGMAADKAPEGTTWLSSQNRNFRNRMGKGAIGNLASAPTVAASSFSMSVTDPRELLGLVDEKRYNYLRGAFQNESKVEIGPEFEYNQVPRHNPVELDSGMASGRDQFNAVTQSLQSIEGGCQRFGADIDTDQIIPSPFLEKPTDEEIGANCFAFLRPEFASLVKQGQNIVVADEGFGSGSSREEAVRGLRGAGVRAVIAKSFAYIFARNMPNLGLLGIVLKDSRFYERIDAATPEDPARIKINLAERSITVSGLDVAFDFQLSAVEETLLSGGGAVQLFKTHGPRLFAVAAKKPGRKPLKETQDW